jgi:hypothetical protein
MTENKDDKKINSLKKNWKIIASGVTALIFVALIAATAYFYMQWKKATSNPQISSQEEVAAIKKKISAFIELPSSEEPTLATVTDVEKLKDQPFFSKAQNGDKVIIYTNSQKAILYRPSTGKIVDMMSLGATASVPIQNSEGPQQTAVSEQAPPQTEQAQPTPNQAETPVPANAKVAVYNGARINGLAQKIADSISQIAGIEITEKTNAQGNYKKTLVIDLTGQNGILAENLAESTGGETRSLPPDEMKPDADILIIGGKDFQ